MDVRSTFLSQYSLASIFTNLNFIPKCLLPKWVGSVRGMRLTKAPCRGYSTQFGGMYIQSCASYGISLDVLLLFSGDDDVDIDANAHVAALETANNGQAKVSTVAKGKKGKKKKTDDWYMHNYLFLSDTWNPH